MTALILIGVILAIGFVAALADAFKDKDAANAKLSSLDTKVQELLNNKDEWEKWQSDIEAHYQLLQKEKKDLNTLVAQRSQNFPLLGEVYKEYYDIKAEILAAYLTNKSHPAVSSAQAVKDSNKEKRELISEVKALNYKIKNYELVAPFLTELEEEAAYEPDDWRLTQDYSDEESNDEVTQFLTKEEYRKLSVSDRNQLALDRYWERRKKSNWAVGKMYEQYVGYIYESQGWEVEYFGIKMRYEDAGRDLIAQKNGVVHVVQCKNWSKYKEVFENHIFQLFGTTYEYQQQHQDLKVIPVFFSSTRLSERAKVFAETLKIKVVENKKLTRYPCIKCNINPSNKEKIYHLPFDQQYDNTKVDKKGETYTETVAEAEALGFRRAYRWHGTKE
jgi:restriction endonuclease